MELRVQFNNDHTKGDASCARCADATAIVQRTAMPTRYPDACTSSANGASCGGLRHADAELLLGSAPAVFTVCERCGHREARR
jgi:hypothetical protein